ncbi:hypothetical protein B8W72_18550 [Pseudomonas putida]|uniref:Uncharacterized protein n=1 Tax=Pseudomonas putida TaxID=303 RepID=A0A1Y3KUI9_PSEPU|nr:hypothetical protein B8W72_18550 [Pseudomonas putida]
MSSRTISSIPSRSKAPWLRSVPVGHTVSEIGMFGNQNTVCGLGTPKWRSTIERLKERFPHSHDMAAT